MSDPVKDPNKKVHWFLLSFMVPVPGQWQPASFMGSYTSKNLSLPIINALRESNGMPADAVLTGISYVGMNTLHKMRGTSDAPVRTVLSDAYRQGLIAAQVHVKGTGDPVNPYEAFANQSQELLHKANEWAEGLAEGLLMKQTISTLNPSQHVEALTPHG